MSLCVPHDFTFSLSLCLAVSVFLSHFLCVSLCLPACTSSKRASKSSCHPFNQFSHPLFSRFLDGAECRLLNEATWACSASAAACSWLFVNALFTQRPCFRDSPHSAPGFVSVKHLCSVCSEQVISVQCLDQSAHYRGCHSPVPCPCILSSLNSPTNLLPW